VKESCSARYEPAKSLYNKKVYKIMLRVRLTSLASNIHNYRVFQRAPSELRVRQTAQNGSWKERPAVAARSSASPKSREGGR